MRGILYFIVGLLCLPVVTAMMIIEFITGVGEEFISSIKFRFNFDRNLKRMSEDED